MNGHKVIALIFFILSCKEENKEKIIIEILTAQLYSNSLDLDDKSKSVFETESKLNRLEFKIQNLTNFTQIIHPICHNSKDVSGCSSVNSFPKANSGLSLNNAIISDESSNSPKREGSTVSFSDNFLDYLSKRDSITNNYHYKLGHNKTDRYYTDYNLIWDNNTIKLAPLETLFFETYITLPINTTNEENSSEIITLKRTKNYRFSLIFHSDSTEVKKSLSKIQKLNFEKNNWKIYSGDIVSKKSIPLIVK